MIRQVEKTKLCKIEKWGHSQLQVSEYFPTYTGLVFETTNLEGLDYCQQLAIIHILVILCKFNLLQLMHIIFQFYNYKFL